MRSRYAGLRYLWPSNLVPLREVTDWIAGILPNHPMVLGPVRLHSVRRWSVTAGFGLQPAEKHVSTSERVAAIRRAESSNLREAVVFKASLLTRYEYAPRIYRLLTKYCDDDVPRFMASEDRPRQTWSLFRAFPGRPIQPADVLQATAQVARTFARIQTAFTKATDDERAELPTLDPAELPRLFEDLLHEIEARHLQAWLAEGAALLKKYKLTRDAVRRLEQYRPLLREWIAELAEGHWPLTVNHAELITENVCVGREGRLVLCDWEQATLNLPFFPLDLLIDEAQRCGDDAPSASVHNENGLNYSLAASAVRQAYLEAIPWGEPEARARAFDLAMLLAPLKTYHERRLHEQAIGNMRGDSEFMAACAARALDRWENWEG